MDAVAVVLLQLLPGLLSSVMAIVDAVRGAPGLPDDLTARLEGLHRDLADLNQRIQAMPLPGDDDAPPGPGA